MVLFITALLLRILFLLEASSAPFFTYLIGDSRFYHDWALRIAGGDWIGESIFWVDPLYAYFLGLLYLVFGPASWAPLLIQAMLGAFTAVFVYAIGRRTFSEAAGLLAGALAAAYDLLLFYDGVLLKTSLTTFLCTACLLALLHAAVAKRLRHWILSGVLVGLCCLVRSSFLIFVPCVFLWAFSLNWKGIRGGLLLRLLLFFLGAAAAIAPVTVRNVAITKSFVLLTANLGQNLYIGNNPFNQTGTYTAPPFIREESEHEEEDWRRHAENEEQRRLTPPEISSFWVGRTLDWMKKNPGDFFSLLLKKLRLSWNRFEVPDNYDVYFYRQEFSRVLKLSFVRFGVVAPLALAGLVIGLRHWRKRLLLYLCFLALAALPVAFFVFARFRMPYVPLLCLFGAFFITFLVEWIKERKWLNAVGGLLLLAVAALFVNLPITGMAPSLSVKPYYNMGLYHVEQEDYASALEWCQKGIDTIERLRAEGKGVSHRASDFYNCAGGAYWKMGRADEAKAAYEKAIEINPRERYAHRNLALIHWELDDRVKALASFRKHVAVNPTQKPELFFHEGIYYLDREAFGEAVEAFRRLKRIQPGDARVMTLLGAALLGTGDSTRAEAALLEAVNLDPYAGEAYYHLARIQADHDSARARAYCEKARALGYEVPASFLSELDG
jgi:tetratricopeptide (TPR) repeat protein